MGAQGYTVTTGTSAVALVAATAKTAINVIAATNATLTVCEIGVSFDGVTANAVPVLIEMGTSTQGAAGTSTSATFVQVRGRTGAARSTGGVNYSAEPTTLTVARQWLITPTGLPFVLQFPLGREPEGDATTIKGVFVRLTAPAVVNYRAHIEIEE